MKYRDHEKIMREREQAIADMRKRHEQELARLRGYQASHEAALRDFFACEIADRERIMDNYAVALDRLDAEIRILTSMLLERGVEVVRIDARVYAELAELNEDEVQP